jgi:predicted RNA-binding protein with PIN domain
MPEPKVLIIDGYNVINRLPDLKPALVSLLENARLQLALRVSAWVRLHPETECLIIFDGNRKVAHGGGQNLAGVRCVFSRQAHGGDEEIIRRVREFRLKKRLVTVVSDDNQVANNCRAHGAIIEPARFLAIPKASLSNRPAKPGTGGKGIDARTAARINKEMAEVFGRKE